MLSKTSGPKMGIYHPGVYFGIFLIANIFLSYTSVGLLAKVWIGIMGVLLPLGLALGSFPSGRSKDYFFNEKEEGPFQIPLWIWIFLGALAIFFRFYRLVSLPVWPMWDDAYNALWGLHTFQQGGWHLTYTSEGKSPLFFWGESLFYRWIVPSHVTLWLFPAFISVLTLGIGGWAVKRYFSAQLSFLFMLVLGFSFWPLYLGRFNDVKVLVPLWEFMVLGVFSFFLNPLAPKKGKGWAFLLAMIFGTGFYVDYITMPLILLMSLAWVGIGWKRDREKGVLVCFFLTLLLFFSPLAFSFFQNFFTGHIHEYLSFHPSTLPVTRLSVFESYGTVLLWGTLEKVYFSFGPLWGGFLNPILGSFFLLGIIEVWRTRSKNYFWGMIVVFGVLMLPGIVSVTVEFMRIVALLPFVLALVALGWKSLLSVVPIPWTRVVLILSLLASVALDFYHLEVPYHQWAIPNKYSLRSKSPERYQAFQILENRTKTQGPGLIFTEFYHDVFDQSLLVTTYNFNAVENPRLDPSKAHWAAVLLGDYDRVEFEKRFPKSKFYPLQKGLAYVDPHMMLAVLPVSQENQKVFLNWIQTDIALQRLYPQIPYHVPQPSYQYVITCLWSLYGQDQQDSFLRKCLLEKIVDYSLQGEDLTQALPLLSLTPEDLELPVCFHPECAILFHQLGIACAHHRQFTVARKAFQWAFINDPHYPIQKALTLLDQVEQKSRSLLLKK